MNIKKDIRGLVLEILVASMFLFISIPIWLSSNNESYASIAKEYSNNNIIDIVSEESLNASVTGNSIDKINIDDVISFKVKNFSGKKGNYKLVLKVNDSNNINNLWLVLNNQNKSLLDYDYYNVGKNYYFILDIEDINSYQTKSYRYKLWINEEHGVIIPESFSYTFIVA